MNDLDKERLPLKSKIKKKITQPQDSHYLKKLKEQQTREFVEGSVDEIGFNLLKKFVDMGLTTTKESFTKDLALVIDCIRGLIYRDFNMAHAAQLLSNKMVSVRFNRGGKASSARIDYSDFMKDQVKKQKPTNVLNKELKDFQKKKILHMELMRVIAILPQPIINFFTNYFNILYFLLFFLPIV